MMQTGEANVPAVTVCSLPRRFAAMSYDALLILSLWFFATFLLLPLSSGEAISSDNMVYPLFLYITGYVYFSWQWCHGGQTLGMRAWHVKLVSVKQPAVTWKETLFRYVLATFSLLLFYMGYFWALIDKDSLTLHDRFSCTYPVKTEN